MEPKALIISILFITYSLFLSYDTYKEYKVSGNTYKVKYNLLLIIVLLAIVINNF